MQVALKGYWWSPRRRLVSASVSSGRTREEGLFLFFHSQSWRERENMLKSRIRLLVTLVLALAATTVFSTLCPARDLRSPDGSVAAAGTGSVKQKPVALSGDPDAPQAPPPPVHMSSGITSPSSVGGSLVGEDLTGLVRWISWIWATWYWRAAP